MEACSDGLRQMMGRVPEIGLGARCRMDFGSDCERRRSSCKRLAASAESRTEHMSKYVNIFK